MSNELVRENQAQRREIKKLNEELVRAGKVIAKADDLYIAKDAARGEQEGR